MNEMLRTKQRTLPISSDKYSMEKTMQTAVEEYIKEEKRADYNVIFHH
jgi:hypothetical protein